MRTSRKYDFSHAPTEFQQVAEELCKTQNIHFHGNGARRIINLKNKTYSCRSLSNLVLIVFGLINVFGRFCPRVPDFTRAVEDSDRLFLSLGVKLSTDSKPRVTTIYGAERLFESYKRTSSISKPITLPLKRSRQAVAAAAIALMVCEYVKPETCIVDVFQGYKIVLNVLKSQSVPCYNNLLVNKMANKVFRYFRQSEADSQMIEYEHYAKFVLENVFSGQLDPQHWRQVDAKRTQIAETKTMTLKELQKAGLKDTAFLQIERIVESIEGSVIMAVFDVPWFVTHANFTTFCGDLAFKVLDCGDRFARCVVVATPEVFALWRKRVLIASCKFDSDVQSTHEVVSAFWDDQVTRGWLMKRFWWSLTLGTVSDDCLGDLASDHYRAFYCLMPVLVRLDGRCMAAALAIDESRYLDPENSHQVFEALFVTEPEAAALRTHYGALLALKFGGKVERSERLYAVAMDARFDIEWRVELVKLLADSMAWSSTAKFVSAFSEVDWPITEQHDAVSEEVAKAAVSIVRCLSAEIRTLPPKQTGQSKSTFDWFGMPACFNRDQDFVLMTNPLLLNVAYAYEAIPVYGETIPAAFKPLEVENLAPLHAERLLLASLEGEEKVEKMSWKEVMQRYRKAIETFRSPLLTPRTPSRPPVPFHQ